MKAEKLDIIYSLDKINKNKMKFYTQIIDEQRPVIREPIIMYE